ncbi:MAG TPA: hypothetical protein VJA85_09255 [Candidatus Limnocylindria bacterium]|nr:hypothetical protein [Candidatus Limnocylindria bacterium]
MLSLGVLLVILGVGSFVLPMVGYQFSLMEPIEPYQPWAGVIVAAVGLITVLWAGRRRSQAQTQTTVVNEAPPASPPADSD